MIPTICDILRKAKQQRQEKDPWLPWGEDGREGVRSQSTGDF